MSDTTTSTPDLHVPTAMIVAAFLRGTTVAADALPGLINTVHQTLAGDCRKFRVWPGMMGRGDPHGLTQAAV